MYKCTVIVFTFIPSYYIEWAAHPLGQPNWNWILTMLLPIVGLCDDWRYPYRMCFDIGSLYKLNAVVISDMLEFIVEDPVHTYVAACRLQDRGSWRRHPTFGFEVLPQHELIWTFTLKGYFFMQPYVEMQGQPFAISFSKRQKLEDTGIEIVLERGKVHLYGARDALSDTERLCFVGLAYFIWLRYT